MGDIEKNTTRDSIATESRREHLLTVVSPMYNEEQTASVFYNRMSQVLEKLDCDYELILVDDGSRDNTLSVLKDIAEKDSHVKLITFSRNFGQPSAVLAGIHAVSGDIIVVIDADLQDPPELIPDMIAKWREGFDVVYSKRRTRKGENWFKLFSARMFYRFINSISEIDMPLDTGDFRLIDRKVADVIRKLTEKRTFLRGLVPWVGYKQYALEYDRDARYAGETKYGLKNMLLVAMDGITSFSSFPLRFWIYPGIASIAISLILLLLFIVLEITTHYMAFSGWNILIMLLFFIGGIQLFAMGALGEYLYRALEETKDRPRYIVREHINFDDSIELTKKGEIKT